MNATVELRSVATAHFPPSAVNFHYHFSLRDVASTLYELCHASNAKVLTPLQIVSMWYHDVSRVFCDKLSSEKDCARMAALVVETSKKHLDFDMAELVRQAKLYQHVTMSAAASGVGASGSGSGSSSSNSSGGPSGGGGSRNDDVLVYRAVESMAVARQQLYDELKVART